MKKIIIITVAAFLLVVGGWLFYSYGGLQVFKPTDQTKTAVITDKAGSSIIENLKNGTYVIDDHSITLANGLSEKEIAPGSSAKQITKYFGNEAVADLNGDGKVDAAFLLTQDDGGSGTFYYVAVALATNKGYQGTNAIFLGDRIAPQTTEIKNGIITVNYAERNPGESFATQPSLGISHHFKIAAGALVEIK